MKKLLTTISLISIFSMPSMASSFKTFTPFTPQQNYAYNHNNPNYQRYNYQNPYNRNYYNPNRYTQKFSARQLSNLEQNTFGEKYTYDSADARLARLEQQMLGSIQTGDLDTRYKRLQDAAQINPTNNNYYYQPQRGNFWSNLGSLFLGGGMVTGATPQINYNDPFNNYGYGKSIQDANGNYYNNFYDMQSKSGVTILD